MTRTQTARAMVASAIKRQGLTHSDLAHATGLSNQPNFISMIVKGRSKLPLKRVPAFATALGLDPLKLLRAVYTERSLEEWAALCEVFGVDPSKV